MNSKFIFDCSLPLHCLQHSPTFLMGLAQGYFWGHIIREQLTREYWQRKVSVTKRSCKAWREEDCDDAFLDTLRTRNDMARSMFWLVNIFTWPCLITERNIYVMIRKIYTTIYQTFAGDAGKRHVNNDRCPTSVVFVKTSCVAVRIFHDLFIGHCRFLGGW